MIHDAGKQAVERDALYNVVPRLQLMLDIVRDKVRSRQRLDRAEGQWLLTPGPPPGAGRAGQRNAVRPASREDA